MDRLGTIHTANVSSNNEIEPLHYNKTSLSDQDELTQLLIDNANQDAPEPKKKRSRKPKAIVSDIDELINNAESDINISTTSTSNTDAAYSQHTPALEPALTPKSADKKEKKPKVEDSLLSLSLADKLRSTLALDEVTGDWYRCAKGIWKPTTKVGSLKIINQKLHEILPMGFGMAKLSSIEGFLKIYLSTDTWGADRSLLPLKNGVLDTKTFCLEPLPSKT